MWSGQISNLAYFEGKKNMGDQSNIKRQPQKKNSDDHRIFSMVCTPLFKSVIKEIQKVH